MRSACGIYVVVILMLSGPVPAQDAPAPAENFVAADVAGKVADADGKPLRGVRVYFNHATGALMDLRSPEAHRDLSALTDGDGHYELTLRFRGGPLIVREVFAELDGFVRGTQDRLSIALRAGDTATVDFVLHPGMVVSGDVRIPLNMGQLAAGVRQNEIKHVLLVDGPALAGLTDNARAYMTQPGGHFEIYLPPGKYSLRALGSPDLLELKDVAPGQRNLVIKPEPFAWTDAEVGAAFEGLWSAMDASYSYFFLKKDVDWQQLKTEYAPRAAATRNSDDLAAVLRDMLGHLHDMHVWVETAKGLQPTYRSSWNYNGNMKVVRSHLDQLTECGKYAIVGRTKPDGFGYFLMLSQSAATPDLVKQAADAIAGFHDAPGFVVDLRIANGGSEPLAAEIAKHFCAKDVVYAKSKYRNGPEHESFTPEFPRTLAASSSPYTKPVVCLIGPGAISSGENFVQMMLALPNVKTIGLPTRGASGNPQVIQVGRTGVKVYFSRWVDLMPDGKPFEGTGIVPMVKVDLPDAAYADEDPTLEKGIEVLRGQH